MASPRDLQDLEFKGAGSYWNTVQSNRRAARSQQSPTPRGSEGTVAQRHPRYKRRLYESPSRAKGKSVACDPSSIMGPIKENGKMLWCVRDRVMLILDPGTKRKATDEPNTPSDSKRIKSSNSEEPETNNIPKAPNVIPFPEKVN